MSTAPQGSTPAQSAASALDLLERSRHGLLEASHSAGVSQRYLAAHLAALRAAAALLAARTPPGRGQGPRRLWDLVPAVAPELTEWAGFFAATEPVRRRLESGEPAVTAREADDLVRQAEVFADLVCRVLGLPVSPPHGDVLVPTAWA